MSQMMAPTSPLEAVLERLADFPDGISEGVLQRDPELRQALTPASIIEGVTLGIAQQQIAIHGVRRIVKRVQQSR